MSRSSSTAPRGDPDRNLGALAWPASYLEISAQSLDPLAHRREPHAGSAGRGIEPSPVVDHPGQHRLALRPQSHLDIPRSRMAARVGEGLLQDAQQLYADLRGELLREPVLDLQRYLALGRQLPVELHHRFDRFHERPLPLVPQVVDGATQARGRPSEGLELLLEIRSRTPGAQVGDPQRLEGAGEVLEDHVVEIPRYPATLLLLGARLDLPGAQTIPLLIRPLTLGDVRRDADYPDLPVPRVVDNGVDDVGGERRAVLAPDRKLPLPCLASS